MSQELELTGARQCYICLETSADASSWVSPCRCAGSLAWVHQECILRWVRQQERQHSSQPVCPQCRTPFLLTPEKGPVVITLDLLYKRVVPACKLFSGTVVTVVAVDAACATLGIFALSQVYGLDEVLNMVQETDAMEMLAHAHLVAYSLLLVSYVPWEDTLLQLLQKSSKLPLLGAFLPANVPARYHEITRRVSWSRTVARAVLLPMVSNIIGIVFFSFVESDLKRVLVGGTVFLTVKGWLYMFQKQKRMVRRSQMEILPVEDNEAR